MSNNTSNKDYVYIGLIWKKLVVMSEDGAIVEEIPIERAEEHIEIVKGRSSLLQNLKKKYPRSVFLFEEGSSTNYHLFSKLLEMNSRKLEDIKSSAKRVLERAMKDNMGRDKIIILLFDALNHYEKIINESVVRIHELSVYVFPGVYEQYSDNEEFVKDIARWNMRYERILDSIIEDKDYISILRRLADLTSSLFEVKKEIEKLIERMIKEIMPNTSYLLGPKLAAKLLSEMGSLEKLAFAPSSTIQVIGAEKSLFLHLTGRGKSPKHGIIFLSEFIQKVPKKHRGKVARVLSLKISKCAKMDYFSGGKEFIANTLRKEMDEFVSSLMK